MDGIILVFAGVYALLVGTGVIKASKSEIKNEEWRGKWGGEMKGAGIVMVAAGAILLFFRIR